MKTELAVYDGTRFLGLIVETDNGREAFDAEGRSLGFYATRKAAMSAIPAHVGTVERGRRNFAFLDKVERCPASVASPT